MNNKGISKGWGVLALIGILLVVIIAITLTQNNAAVAANSFHIEHIDVVKYSGGEVQYSSLDHDTIVEATRRYVLFDMQKTEHLTDLVLAGKRDSQIKLAATIAESLYWGGLFAPDKILSIAFWVVERIL